MTIGNFGRNLTEVLRKLHEPEAAVVPLEADRFVGFSPQEVVLQIEAGEGECFFYLRSDHGRLLPDLTLSGLAFGFVDLKPHSQGLTYEEAIQAVWWVGDFGQELVWTPEQGIVLPAAHNRRQFYTAEKPAEMYVCYWSKSDHSLHLQTKDFDLGGLDSKTPQMRRRAQRLYDHIAEYAVHVSPEDPGEVAVINISIHGHSIQVQLLDLSEQVRVGLPRYIVDGIKEIYAIEHFTVPGDAPVLAYR
ncbi:MAG: hypothetical protein HYW33_00940 [Candidatus Blackburnbacteria bacterium]|nr:hypothetical protein [Candidatus Blackburnbacteria bacterium]